MNRRDFLCTLTTVAAGSRLAERILANSYGAPPPVGPSGGPARVKGAVFSAGRPLGGIAVTDGASVVVSSEDGSFELPTTSDRDFVYITVPSGHRIPANETGTARFYQPLELDARAEMSVRFDLDPLEGSDEEHRFYLLADPQTEDRYEVERFHAETVPDVAGLESSLSGCPVFAFGCGDLMFDHLELFPEYERAVRRMGVPFFQVVGNHDLDQSASTNRLATRTFRSYFGPEYYSFNRGAVHYVVLNDVFWFGAGYLGYLPDQQLDWLREDLGTVEAGSPVVVVLHIPVAGTQYLRQGETNPTIGGILQNREELYRILEPYRVHVLSGHTHECEHTLNQGCFEHVHGAVCGAWWSGPICYDGTPCGYGVYEVRGEKLQWRYKSTGREIDHQMRLYHVRTSEGPGEVLANVWNWEWMWKVFWYENGSRRGEMRQLRGQDPLSTRLHLGPDLPERRTWVEPVMCDHLFSAPISRDAREVRVEAVDRFGRVYSEKLDWP